MRTKQAIQLALIGGTFGILTTGGLAETVAETLEKGVQLQQNDGDLDEAIKNFKAVVRQESKWKKLAAEAHFRLAECYQAKGDDGGARQHVESLRKNFPADNRWVIKAAGLLPAETNFGPAPWRDGHFYQWVIKLKNGQELGYFLAAEHVVEAGDDPIWESYIVRNGGNESLSRSKYHQNSHKVIDSRWFLKGIADNKTVFGNDGVVRITDSETGEEVDTHDHPRSQDAGKMLYENEQMVQLVRCLNLDIGTQQETVLIAGLSNAVPIEFTMEVTAHEDITVPAGTYPCAKVETNLKQTFYISRDDERRVVMMDLGTAKVVLHGEEAWNSLKPIPLVAEKMGSQVDLPGTVLYWVVADKEEIYRVNLWPTDFAGRDGMFEVNLTKNLIEDAKASARGFAETIMKNAGKKFDEWDAVEESWEELKVDGVDAVAVEVTGRMGEINLHEYQIFAVGEEKALSLRMGFAAPDRDRTKARAKEIVAKFRWDG
ncbi:tetratricopeptide repeat protein [Haloferula sp.]|uniref:tetratricopeptide repeat protein n=1 Tax=Haloferula sp. TaxID=2497595 RepID=UPI00329AF45D